MRVHVNLATRPYEDVAAFYRTWGLALGVVAVITVILMGLTISSLVSARTVGKQTAQLREKIAALDKEKQAVQDLLNRPENRETRDRSRFLNELIARKAFSWTDVFSDLEKIVPAHVRVLSITPGITDDNRIQVAMRVQAESRDKDIELVRRMNESKTFRQAQLRSETLLPGSGATKPGVQFDIMALYEPKVPPVAAPKAGGPAGGAR